MSLFYFNITELNSSAVARMDSLVYKRTISIIKQMRGLVRLWKSGFLKKGQLQKYY